MKQSVLRRRGWRIVALGFGLVALMLGAAFLALMSWKEPTVDVPARTTASRIGAVHFGGPGMPAQALRNLLLQRVRATPAGQSIDWATYYFLDAELAQALIDASRRGVRVRLVVEGDPRFEAANGTVVAMLRKDGLRGGLTVRPAASFPFQRINGKLHAKIYAFSWPTPVALVGSFNPSGGKGDDNAAILAEIGDQDRGHNMLVEITSAGLVDALVDHIGLLALHHGSVSRFSRENNRILRDRDTALFFYPRLHTDIVEAALDRLGPGDHLWAAISHLKGDAVGTLEDAAERGARIDLIVHDSERRVPQRVVDRLTKDGIDIRRYRHPDGLPMHDKFFVIENSGSWVTYFGSLNFNTNSRFLNDEVLVRSTDSNLARALLRRFADLDQEVDRQTSALER
ncbi:phospholipase D-like domain-containing protein [Sphingomonas sp.]|uniref:phospholipase D-like domain-containing protein n=1 Tax=Sphingomonas sp. TaxID=28214 RepID=UPI003B3A4C6E